MNPCTSLPTERVFPTAGVGDISPHFHAQIGVYQSEFGLRVCRDPTPSLSPCTQVVYQIRAWFSEEDQSVVETTQLHLEACYSNENTFQSQDLSIA